MKRLPALFLCLALLLGLLPLPVRGEAASPRLVICSTTDLHGKCWDTQVMTGRPEHNNLLRISSAVAELRETYGAEQVLLVDNGDLYQGDPTSGYPLSLLENGETDLPPVMAVGLGYLGYTAAGLGNHEFNFSWEVMEQARAYLADQGVPSVCANLYYDGSDGIHPAGTPVLIPWIIREVPLGDRTVRVGLLGLNNTDCAKWDDPVRYPGMTFVHPDNVEASIVWEAEHWLPDLADCDLVAVFYHGGLGTAEGPLVYGENTENQALRLVTQTAGIDLVIAGHDHFRRYSNQTFENREGQPVPVVNGGGTSLTKTVFVLTEGAEGPVLTLESSENLEPGNYPVDPELEQLLAPYAALVAEYMNKQQYQPAAEERTDWSGAYLLGSASGVIFDPDAQTPVDGTRFLDRLRGTPRITAEGNFTGCGVQLIRSDLDAYLVTFPALGAEACLEDAEGTLRITTDRTGNRLWQVVPWEEGWVLQNAVTGRYVAYHAAARRFALEPDSPRAFRLWEGNDPCLGFDDLRPTAWYHEAVDDVISRGLMGSVKTEARIFAPGDPMTRAMLARVLYELAGAPAQTGIPPYTDATEGQWYSAALCWAADTGLMTGYGDGTFGVADPVTREQLASVLYRLDGGDHLAETGMLSGYPDLPEISTWARTGMIWAVDLGLLYGRQAGEVTYLAPQAQATRAEFAAILCRYLRQ